MARKAFRFRTDGITATHHFFSFCTVTPPLGALGSRHRCHTFSVSTRVSICALICDAEEFSPFFRGKGQSESYGGQTFLSLTPTARMTRGKSAGHSLSQLIVQIIELIAGLGGRATHLPL